MIVYFVLFATINSYDRLAFVDFLFRATLYAVD